MATVPVKSRSHRHTWSNQTTRRDEQLLRDRVTAVLVVTGLVALMALVIWLASLGGPVPSAPYFDYWMMP